MKSESKAEDLFGSTLRNDIDKKNENQDLWDFKETNQREVFYS